MRRRIALMAAMVLSLAVTDGAMAQGRRSAPAPRGATKHADDDLPPSVPPPVSTLAPIRGIAGPRLQPGAVLCRTDLDLRHRAEVTRRRIDNEPDPGNPLENCHLVRQETGVDVVEKRGPGLTEVRVKPGGEVGWTDTYLR